MVDVETQGLSNPGTTSEPQVVVEATLAPTKPQEGGLFPLPSQSKEFLKELVRDYLGGALMFSCQVPPDMLSLVFMPIALGALGYKVPQPTPPAEVLKPARPSRPEPGKADISELSVKLQTALAEAQQNLTDTEYKVRWSDATDRDLSTAKRRVTKATNALKKAGVLAQKAVEAAHRLALKAYMESLRDYRKVANQYRADVRAWRVANDTLLADLAAWEDGRKAYFDSVNQNLGVLYGYHKDTFPRSINGYPMFHAMGMLNRPDWERVRSAIEREQERAKDLDV